MTLRRKLIWFEGLTFQLPPALPAQHSRRAAAPLQTPPPAEAWAPQMRKCPGSAEPRSTERLWVTVRSIGGFRWAVSTGGEKSPLLPAAKSDSERFRGHVSVDPGLPGERPWPRAEPGCCACAESTVTPLLPGRQRLPWRARQAAERSRGGAERGLGGGRNGPSAPGRSSVTPHTAEDWLFFHESFQTQLRDHFAASFVQLRG